MVATELVLQKNGVVVCWCFYLFVQSKLYDFGQNQFVFAKK